MFIYNILNALQLTTIIECKTNDDCTGDSDTCISNYCHCGSIAKCTGRTDTCKAGVCTCGENDECSEAGLEVCRLGECQGNILLKFQIL